jgi:hypothetical protein
VGNILCHLDGNLKQWMLAGVGGQSNKRDRAAEFAATEGHVETLLQELGRTTRASAEVIEALTDIRLMEPITIQGFSTTVLSAVLQVTEHFSWHVGQATWIAKCCGGLHHGLSFYDEAKLNAAE